MRDNRSDKTIERNYTQKWRFLIAEYELVKANKHPKFRFAQDFHPFHGVNRQTFAKYYNRHRASGGGAAALLPAKRGPRWRTRRTLPFIEQLVLAQRSKGNNRYDDGELTMGPSNRALREWEAYYNAERPHQSLGWLSPMEYLAEQRLRTAS